MEDTKIYVHSECCSAHCKLVIRNAGESWLVCEKCGKPLSKLRLDPGSPVVTDTHDVAEDTVPQDPRCEIDCGVNYNEVINEHAVPIEVFSFHRNGVRAELCAGTTFEIEDKPLSVWRVRPVSNFPLKARVVGLDGKHFDSREAASIELSVEGVDPYVMLCELLGFGQHLLESGPDGEACQL